MMQTNRFDLRPFFLERTKKQIELMLGHSLKGLVLERGNRLALLLVTHDAEESHHRPHLGGELAGLAQSRFIDRLVRDLKLSFHVSF